MLNNYKKWFLMVLCLVLIGGVIYFYFTSCRSVKQISVLGHDMRAITACSSPDKIKGMGGVSRDAFSERADVMIFKYKSQKQRSFWMKGMQFPLDIVWMKDGKIVKIDTDVPAPKEGENPIVRTSSPFDIDTVLEFPAGGVNQYGLTLGIVIPELK